jgi:putative membrane protein insertion efficiency factor
MRPLALTLLRGYQTVVSPYLRAQCRYHPSCSHYSYEAVERYGVLKGGALTLRRLARCQPWGGGGLDPVP